MRPSRRDRGSVLALVPAGFLVLLLLGGIAVDSAVTVLGQHELADATAAAANDAATEALGAAAFYGSGALEIDPSTAAAVVCRDLTAQGDGSLHNLRVAIAVAGPTIGVQAAAHVDAVFGRLVPGFGVRTVTARSVAVAARGAAASRPTVAHFIAITCNAS